MVMFMSLSEELNLLHDLHVRGALSSEEFARAKAKLLAKEETTEPPFVGALNSLRRSREDRWIAGVCGGLARASGVDAWVWRLAFTVLLLCGGTGLAVYVLMWIFVPLES